VIWNWDTQSSSYNTLKQAGFDKSGGNAWLTESASPTSSAALTGTLIQVAQNNAALSGYGDATGAGAVEEATADADKLVGSINANSLWITRLHGELPRAALGKDLEVGASITQTPVSNYIQTTIGVGTPPPCPVYDCSGGGTFDSGSGFFGNGVGSGSSSKCGISLGGAHESGTASLGGLGALIALAMIRRRKSR
jgi:hypothetical protein